MSKAISALAAAIFLAGAVSVAQAANDNQSRDRGGYDIGPLGQCFAPPDCDQGGDDQGYGARRYGYGGYGYGYAPRYYYHGRWHRLR
ncbi:MAG TPA: hypothetical protein VKW08_07245 [Xanthobacteraceae bacterium]|nr:hypothetical protein [Xanthobacteraceae bacterium]